jgi:hypothetical protein
VIAIIGILLLVGIVKKNAIMMIDFAIERRNEGLDALPAIREAALIRFRPIFMTTLAAILGAVIDHYTHRLRRRVDAAYGYTPNPEGVREFLRELQEPTFAEAGADAMKNATGRDTFLYRAVNVAHQRRYGKPWQSWDQGNAGTCVSMAFGLGEYAAECVDHVAGKTKQPPLECATEPIYGGSRTAARLPPMDRNLGGDGSYGGAAARWLTGNCQDRRPSTTASVSTAIVATSRSQPACTNALRRVKR